MSRSLLYTRSDRAQRDSVENFATSLEMFDIRLVELDENSQDVDEPDIAFIAGSDYSFRRYRAGEETLLVILDTRVEDPRDLQPADQFGARRISPEAPLTGGPNWLQFLNDLGEKLELPDLVMEWNAQTGVSGTPREAVQEASQSSKIVDAEAQARSLEAFQREAGSQFVELTESKDWQNESGHAFVAARFAEKQASLAARRAIKELGRHFSHSIPDDKGRQWGRIRWGAHNAVYEGETDGVDAHGHGVLTLEHGGKTQTYAGQFIKGQRCGFGVGGEDLTPGDKNPIEKRHRIRWVGAWFDDQPRGHGVVMRGVGEADNEVFQGQVRIKNGGKRIAYVIGRAARLFGVDG